MIEACGNGIIVSVDTQLGN